MKKADLELIKQINQRLILSTIRTKQPISRAMLSKELGLSKSTVSAIVEELIKKKFILEKGQGASTKEGGRKGIHLVFNPKSSFGVGVDIGGTKILLVISDLDGEIMNKKEYPTTKNPDEIIVLIKDFIYESGVTFESISAMGVGVPSIIDTNMGIVIDAPSLKWREYPFLTFLKSHFPFPCFLNNDVNCAMHGELRFGAGKDCSDLIFIAIGTGVGSAIYANGQLIEGAKFSAGEIGYFVDKEEIEKGYKKTAGEFGAFENKTSGTALSSHGYSSIELFQRYYEGDNKASEIMERFILDLSIGIANAAILLNPDKVLIGGGVSRSMSGILKEVQQNVNQWTPFEVAIELSQFQSDAGAIGAVAYAYQMLETL